MHELGKQSGMSTKPSFRTDLQEAMLEKASGSDSDSSWILLGGMWDLGSMHQPKINQLFIAFCLVSPSLTNSPIALFKIRC